MSGHIMLKILTVFMLCAMHIVGWCLDVGIETTNVKCAGESSGRIILQLSDASPDYIVKLYDKTPSVKQQTLEVLTTTDSTITFDNLPAKKYYVSILDGKNQYFQETIIIEEPEKLTYLGFDVEKVPSSETSKDGVLAIKTSGGTAPLKYTWPESANNQKTKKAGDIGYGVYQCEIRDANNCSPIRPHIIFMKPKE